MNNLDLTKSLFVNNVRINTIIHVGGAMAVEERLPDAFDEFISEELSLDNNPFPVPIPKDWVVEGEYYNDNYDVLEWIKDYCIYGFLICVHTPVIRPKDIDLDEDGEYMGSTYTWGHYKTKWIYGEDFYKATEKGIQWAKDVMSKAILAARHLKEEEK